MGKFDIEKKGTYKIKCEIPELPLAPNTYYLWLAMSSYNTLIDRLKNVMNINVARDDVYGTGELPGKNQGYFLAKALWSFDTLQGR